MSYEEQWARVLRWHHRFREINDGISGDRRASDFYIDDIYAFFQNCHHLKDWIINDPALNGRISRQVVEDYITANPDLSRCADLCNATKHYSLRQQRSNENAHLGPRNFSLGVGSAPHVLSIKHEVITDSGSIDAYELANNCLAAWRAFFTSHQLNK